MRKKLVIIGGIVLVLLIAVVAALPFLIDVNQYKPQIQSQLQQNLGRRVLLGNMKLGVFPLGVRVEKPVIAEDDDFGRGKTFAQADELFISVSLFPLLRKEIRVNEIELVRPRIELIRNEQGVWNFASMGKNAPAPPQSTQPPPQQKQQQAKQQTEQAAAQNAQQNNEAFSLGRLRISDGQVAITDRQKHQSRAVYDHIDIELANFAPGEAFEFSITAHLPGQGEQTLVVSGKGGPINSVTMAATPFDGSIKLNQVSLSGFQKFLNSQALNDMDAVLTGEADLKNKDGVAQAKGTFKAENARVRGVEIGYPIAIDFDVADDLNTDVIKVEQANLKLGKTPLTLAGVVNSRPTPMQVDLKMTAKEASISEIARLAAAFGVAFSADMNVDGTISADIHASGAANQPAMNGSLQLRNLQMSGKGVPQPVKVSAIDLALSPDAIRSNPFTATTGGTSVAAQFGLTQYTGASPNVDATIRTTNAEVGEMLRIAQAYGVGAVEGMSGSGRINLDVHAAGPIKNPDAMNMSGTGQISNAVLNMPSLTKPLNVRNANLRFTANSMVMEQFAASIADTNAQGTMTLRNFAAPVAEFTLNVDKLDLVQLQTLIKPEAKAQASLSLIPMAYAAPQPPSLLNKTTGKGQVTVGTIKYNDLLMTNAKSQVVLDHGVIRMQPVTAELFGGATNGSIVIDARRDPVTYTVSSSLQRVDANKLMSSMTSLKQMLYGMLASNANTSFTASSADQVARTLNGKMSLNLENGKLMGLDLMSQLATVGKFLQTGQKTQAYTSLVKLTGNFNIVNGLATTNDLQAQLDSGTMSGTGQINLADQTLNMRVMAVLSKAFSDKAGGTQVGGFMNTALANNKGELVVPVTITGSFLNPRVQPDMEKLAELKMQNMLPTMANPGQLSSSILGLVKGKNASGEQVKPGEAIGGILGALTKKKPDQQQQQNPTAAGQPQNPNQNQAQPNQQQQQQQDPLGGLLQQMINKKKKKDQTQQPAPPPPPPK